MILLLSPEEKGCELIIGTYIFIFNVSKPPLFPVWLRELERGKKPQLPTFFFGRVSCGSVDTTLSSAAVDVIWAVSLLITVGKLTGQAGNLTLLNCYPSCWHRSQNFPTGWEVGLSNSWMYPVPGTLGRWCFAGRLLPVLNTQHSNTFVSLAHLHKEMFPLGQKFSGEAFKSSFAPCIGKGLLSFLSGYSEGILETVPLRPSLWEATFLK